VPSIAEATLLSVLIEDEWGTRIGGQYWDAIIWVTAAWHHYLCTGNEPFLRTAFDVATTSLAYSEANEFDPADGLFRGGACFHDGVAAYPDQFADGPTSCILDWIRSHPEEMVPRGYGLPMKALSTNCLYYNAYGLLPRMAKELQAPGDPRWQAHADALGAAINARFWNPELGTYRYLLDAGEDPRRQEGLGHAFAILLGIADEAQSRSIFTNQHITAHGIPSLWPNYDRYVNAEGTAFGRQSGTIWPQVNAVWAMAALAAGRHDIAWQELKWLAQKACRDVQFSEMYHPLTGAMYGGVQERPSVSDKPVEWAACRRQTWCATGYIRMILSTLLGLDVEEAGLALAPFLPHDVSHVSLTGLHYRNATLTVSVGRRTGVSEVWLNGHRQQTAFIPAGTTGPQHIDIRI
jgi:glycogen debranching enzyme